MVMPGAGGLQSVLNLFELFQQAFVAASGHLQGEVVVFPEQIQVFPAAGGHDIVDRPRQVVGDVLGQHGDPDVTAPDDFAGIRADVAHQQFHESGLARTVTAQESDPFARFDLERSAVQQPRPSEAD